MPTGKQRSRNNQEERENNAYDNGCNGPRAQAVARGQSP